MPKRADLKTVLIIGAGPIVIGQACEFDYSGAQACKALREEGYRVVLVNSNPATIMNGKVLALSARMMGIADVDHARSMNLVDLAVEFALSVLKPGGDLLIKVFQGREFQPLVARLRPIFESVKLRKPKASRGRSAEVYVLARGLRLV